MRTSETIIAFVLPLCSDLTTSYSQSLSAGERSPRFSGPKNCIRRYVVSQHGIEWSI